MNPPDSKLAQAHLSKASRAKDKFRRWRWVIVIGAVALIALVGFATMDYWLMLPPHLRYAAWAILAVVGGLGAWGLGRLLRRPTSLKEAALDAEAQRIEADCVVSTAAEYASGKTTANEYEPELAAALQTEAAQRLEQVRLPYRRSLRRPLSVFAAAVAVAALFVVVTPGGWTALKRIVLPWMRAQYTEVEVKPGSAEVRLGQDVEISGVFSGRPPKSPMLQWQESGGSLWQTVPLTKSGADSFVHSIKDVRTPVTYRVSGGDAVSPDFALTPFVPPEVRHLSVELAYPGYTGLKPVTQTSPEITILRGSTAMVHLRANVPLSNARLRFSDTNIAPVELKAGGDELWIGRFQIARDTGYSIELFDQKGRKGEENQEHHIVAKLDAPPKVEILEPAQDMRADATNRVPVKISVADDYGVAETRLIFHKLNSTSQSVVCQPLSDKNGEWISTGEIDLSALSLKRYDVVAYHVEAKDNNTLDGPGLGTSPLYFIEITDKESKPTPPQPAPGEQINLIVVQKQIIADTVALKQNAPSTNYVELAQRQTNAVELGKLYLKGMIGAPPEVTSVMNSAIAAMEQAVTPLGRNDRNAAIPPEEEALAHLYRVLALLPDLQSLTVLPPPPPPPREQKPQRIVSLQEIKKPAEEEPPPDPAIEEALEEARELSRVQAEVNEAGQKLALAQSRAEATTQPQGKQNTQNQQAKGQGQGQGQPQGQEGTEKPEAASEKKDQLAKSDPEESPAIEKTQGQQAKGEGRGQKGQSEAKAPRQNSDVAEKQESDSGKKEPVAKNDPGEKGGKAAPQMAKAQKAAGKAAQAGKGKGKGTGQQGQGKGGQGNQPGKGGGRAAPPEPAPLPQETANTDPPGQDSEPQSPDELSQKEQELSKEALALAEMLERLAAKGTRVGHNLARSAKLAAQHMEGAAQALKQGNAAGAGMRGTLSSEELDKVVAALESVTGERPDLTDVASEVAPKEFEGFISEYFRKLSYEK